MRMSGAMQPSEYFISSVARNADGVYGAFNPACQLSVTRAGASEGVESMCEIDGEKRRTMRRRIGLCLMVGSVVWMLAGAAVCRADAGPEPQPKVQLVQWPSPEALNLEIQNALSAASREAVSKSPVPVLVPGARDLAEATTVLVGPHWFAASIPLGSDSASINATRVTHLEGGVEPVQEPALRVRGQAARTWQSEGIWNLTWQEFGVYYLLRVGCPSSESPKCEDDSYIRSLAGSLVFVGGQAHGE